MGNSRNRVSGKLQTAYHSTSHAKNPTPSCPILPRTPTAHCPEASHCIHYLPGRHFTAISAIDPRYCTPSLGLLLADLFLGPLCISGHRGGHCGTTSQDAFLERQSDWDGAPTLLSIQLPICLLGKQQMTAQVLRSMRGTLMEFLHLGLGLVQPLATASIWGVNH